MKIVAFVLILFAFVASTVDSIACAGHDFDQAEKVSSFIGLDNSNSQMNQLDFVPFDHCAMGTHLCTGKLAIIVDYSNIIVLCPLLLFKANFHDTHLKLNTFFANSERPPTIF